MLKNRFRSALLAATMLFAAAPAFAVGPNESIIQLYQNYPTYNATIAALTPAASATDFFTITGSATKTIWIRSIGCTGTSTAAASQIVTATLRSTADSGGTSTVPVAVALDSNFVAATGTVAAYTANPTVGTSIGPVNTGLVATLAPASTGTNGLFFNYPFVDPSQIATQANPVVLHGTSQVLALNAGGVSFASGTSLTCTVTWTEH